MEEKKREAPEAREEKAPPQDEADNREIPKKFCLNCEGETATWAYCDQCGKLFWGRIIWDLATGGVCALVGAAMLLKKGADLYEKALAVVIGGAGLWVMSRIIRQLAGAYFFRKNRQSP
jgi:hypothetical protein